MGLIDFAKSLSDDVARDTGNPKVKTSKIVLSNRTRTEELLALFYVMFERTMGKRWFLFTGIVNAVAYQLSWLLGRGFSADAALLATTFSFAASMLKVELEKSQMAPMQYFTKLSGYNAGQIEIKMLGYGTGRAAIGLDLLYRLNNYSTQQIEEYLQTLLREADRNSRGGSLRRAFEYTVVFNQIMPFRPPADHMKLLREAMAGAKEIRDSTQKRIMQEDAMASRGLSLPKFSSLFPRKGDLVIPTVYKIENEHLEAIAYMEIEIKPSEKIRLDDMKRRYTKPAGSVDYDAMLETKLKKIADATPKAVENLVKAGGRGAAGLRGFNFSFGDSDGGDDGGDGGGDDGDGGMLLRPSHNRYKEDSMQSLRPSHNSIPNSNKNDNTDDGNDGDGMALLQPSHTRIPNPNNNRNRNNPLTPSGNIADRTRSRTNQARNNNNNNNNPSAPSGNIANRTRSQTNQSRNNNNNNSGMRNVLPRRLRSGRGY